MQLVASVLEHVGQPLPAVGRLQRDPAVAVDLAQQLQEDRRVIDDPPREQHVAFLVDNGDVRARAVQINPDRMHAWASSVRLILGARWHTAPGTGALGGPLLHGIKWSWVIASAQGVVADIGWVVQEGGASG